MPLSTTSKFDAPSLGNHPLREVERRMEKPECIKAIKTGTGSQDFRFPSPRSSVTFEAAEGPACSNDLAQVSSVPVAALHRTRQGEVRGCRK